MKLQTFTAATFSECLGKVKSQFGRDAVIVHTRTRSERYCLGLRRKELVEITAAQGLNTLHRQVIGSKAPSNGVRIAAPMGTAPPESAGALLSTPAAANVIVRDLFRQMDCLKGMVKELGVQVQHQRAPHVPEELVEHYSLLTACQVCPELAAHVIKAVQRSVRPEYLQNPDFIRDKIAEQIEKMLAVAGPISRTKPRGPHVVALIGPTGVGKTTTIAKLAANLMLREKRRVGLITNDTYRIAAIEQLKVYAKIIGAPLQVVVSQDDMNSAIDAMSSAEFVLIDTAGRSPNDTLKLGELRGVVSNAGADEVHLVLSATSSEECLERAIDKFADARIDKLIFTKLDEADKRGALLNIVNKVHKPLSYVTTGQAVPDDIEVAQGRRIAQLILGSEL